MAHFAHFIEFLYKSPAYESPSKPPLFKIIRFLLSRFTSIDFQRFTVKPAIFPFHTAFTALNPRPYPLHTSKCLAIMSLMSRHKS